MDTYHVTLATPDRRTLCSDEGTRCRAVAAVARAGGGSLLLFCVVDDHVHLVLRGDRARVAQLAGNTSQALRRLTGGGLAPAHIRPVDSRSHLRTLVRYVLDQSSHHALSSAPHPGRWSGSCFWDLVGARRLPGFAPGALQAALPRLSRDEVWSAVGLAPLEPASDDALSVVSLTALRDAGAASIGRMDLHGRSVDVLAARSAVARVARKAAFSDSAVREALRCPERSWRRLLRHPPRPQDERALRLQLTLATAA